MAINGIRRLVAASHRGGLSFSNGSPYGFVVDRVAIGQIILCVHRLHPENRIGCVLSANIRCIQTKEQTISKYRLPFHRDAVSKSPHTTEIRSRSNTY